MAVGVREAGVALMARSRAGVPSYAGMQALGAWMIRAPSVRAFFRNSSSRGASSFSRATALGLVWVSHMSHTITAVVAGSHCSFVAFRVWPVRDCRERFQGSACRHGKAAVRKRASSKRR